MELFHHTAKTQLKSNRVHNGMITLKPKVPPPGWGMPVLLLLFAKKELGGEATWGLGREGESHLGHFVCRY